MSIIKDLINLVWQMIDGWLDDPIIATLCWLLVIWLVTDYILT
jgi:hypothetical protein